MTLRAKQALFTGLVARLILHAQTLGYEVTFGEAYRSPQEAARLANAGLGIRGSLHTFRLALDLNLFKDGVFLTTTEGHRPLGEWWEAQSTPEVTCAWGGRFGDGNHYSLEHAGRK